MPPEVAVEENSQVGGHVRHAGMEDGHEPGIERQQVVPAVKHTRKAMSTQVK